MRPDRTTRRSSEQDGDKAPWTILAVAATTLVLSWAGWNRIEVRPPHGEPPRRTPVVVALMNDPPGHRTTAGDPGTAHRMPVRESNPGSSGASMTGPGRVATGRSLGSRILVPGE
ncbi:hypothetical protein [Pseudosporangium ferrugineum]|uniref:Uncharacterized protein n=1 Tax=Pseudosporangium ferrugineum TaxID=439699 RepID=A0A2T0SBR7_9ACTN|nr:hypothetical protein [Pseudosporangium ferrugineum]PRY30870.1 hypothetical protein CLV70_104422 [Pseudosporangium ferrugineum]